MAYFEEYYGDDPKKMAARDRVLALGRGQDLWRESQSQLDHNFGLENHFRNAAYAQYDPILAGQGGYTAEERDRIAREAELNSLEMTPEEIQQSYYTPEEEKGILGDPERERAYFDPERQRGQYADTAARQRNAASGAIERLYSAAEDPSAQLSSGFSADYAMTPQEAQAIQDAAAMDVRDSYSALQSKLNRDAYASGADVFGAAAARGRFQRQAAAGAADALTRARVATDAEAARRKLDIEQMRLQAAQAGAGRRMSAAQYAGGLMTDVERGLGEQGMGLEQDIRDFGTGQERYIDATQSARRGGLADTRREAAQYNQAQRYQRGFGRNQALSSRYADIAGARRADEAEARGWLTGQQQYAGGQYTNAANRQVQGVATTGQLANQATGNQVALTTGKKPGFWSQLGQAAVGGAIKGFLGGGGRGGGS